MSKLCNFTWLGALDSPHECKLEENHTGDHACGIIEQLGGECEATHPNPEGSASTTKNVRYLFHVL